MKIKCNNHLGNIYILASTILDLATHDGLARVENRGTSLRTTKLRPSNVKQIQIQYRVLRLSVIGIAFIIRNKHSLVDWFLAAVGHAQIRTSVICKNCFDKGIVGKSQAFSSNKSHYATINTTALSQNNTFNTNFPNVQES